MEVIGLARSCNINHPNYEHVFIDLSDLKQLKSFDFKPSITNQVFLVNNAGLINPIKPVGSQLEDDIIAQNNVNITAVQLLCQKFVHRFSGIDQSYQIINISSGAGKRPIHAWSTYCASKAAIDLYTETLALELKNNQKLNWKVYSIAPGVVDTPMQKTIRQSNPNDFPTHSKFVDLKEKEELLPPQKVADLLLGILKNGYPNTVFSIRDLI